MTTLPARIRQAALALPEVEEHGQDDDVVFRVAGTEFTRFHAGALTVRGNDGWDDVALGDDVDWLLVEDRIARAWELSAPRALLEAGGR
jgi:hypothetical protein